MELAKASLRDDEAMLRIADEDLTGNKGLSIPMFMSRSLNPSPGSRWKICAAQATADKAKESCAQLCNALPALIRGSRLPIKSITCSTLAGSSSEVAFAG
jgi:hypothetical protein